MRKILMTATVLAGAAFASHAMAQGIATVPVTTDDFSAANTSAGGDAPAPGSVVVTWRTKLWTDVAYTSDSGQYAKNVGTVTTYKNGVATTATGTAKSNPFAIQNYIRMYPKMDAVAANGLQYGGSVQIRQNAGIQNSAGGSFAKSNAGNTLYVNNYSAYIGTPVAGKLYVGGTTSALGTFMTGTFEAFDVNGGFDGDAPDFLTSGAALNWTPLTENGPGYRTNKIVYVSPKYAGFDVAASFEPNYQNAYGTCAYAGAPTASYSGTGTSTYAGCSNNSSVAGGADLRKNTYDIAARYTGSFGPVAVVAAGGYLGSGVVGNSTGANAYKGIGMIDGGLTATYAGVMVGGHYVGGSVSGDNNLNPLAIGGRKEDSFIAGAQYTFGTMIVGFQAIDTISSNGFVTTAAVRPIHEMGIALGGTWDYASGAAVYATAMYGHRHQGGVNLYTGSAGSNGNSTNARVLTIGNRFAW